MVAPLLTALLTAILHPARMRPGTSFAKEFATLLLGAGALTIGFAWHLALVRALRGALPTLRAVRRRARRRGGGSAQRVLNLKPSHAQPYSHTGELLARDGRGGARVRADARQL